MTLASDKIVGRSTGITYQQLLETDVLRQESAPFQGEQALPIAYYTDRRYHELRRRSSGPAYGSSPAGRSISPSLVTPTSTTSPTGPTS